MANTTADKLQKVLTTKNSIRQAIVNKGVAVPDDTKFADYATKIEQIEAGGIPNYIAPKNNVNGTYKADNIATSFSVNGATDIGSYALGYGFNQCSQLKSVDLSSLTKISGSSAMIFCFYSCSGLTSISLPVLTAVSARYGMSSCFNSCTNITSVNLSSLSTVSGDDAMERCFNNCTSLTSVDLSSLSTVSGTNSMTSCFANCIGLTSISLPALSTLSGSFAMSFCFNNCTNIKSVDLSSLSTISGEDAMYYCFYGCRGLTNIYFPALKSFGTSTSVVNQFNNMLTNVIGCKLHFPSNMQSEVQLRTGYPTFGGINTVVVFDLPATA